MIDLATIDGLTGGRLGTFDVPCLTCGPERRAAVNRRRPVLRIWRIDPGFASFHCARCGDRGHTRDRSATPPDPARIVAARKAAEERERAAAIERLGRAQWLWSRRQPIGGSLAERYLRDARGYGGPLPATLGFLPARGKHGPAMIAAFGMTIEPQPGVLEIEDSSVCGVHITRLAPDGTGKAGTGIDKVMVGRSLGVPIVLAPPNDLLGLALTEGIEDALSVHEATGLGAWAAGAASRLPALAAAIPAYVEAVTVTVDDDADGRRHAAQLQKSIAPHIEVRSIMLTGALKEVA
jgi:hypothetical protein